MPCRPSKLMGERECGMKNRVYFRDLERKVDEINRRNGWTIQCAHGELVARSAYGNYSISKTSGMGSTGESTLFGPDDCRSCMAFLEGFDYQ